MSSAPIPGEASEAPKGPTVRVTHLVAGLIFLGLAGLWLLAERDVIASGSLVYALPVLLIVAGTIGLLASVLGGLTDRRRRVEDHDEMSGAVGSGDPFTTTRRI